MTETPKRKRGRPAGDKLSAETKAKISAAAKAQHADPEAHARWRAGMEVVWARKRAEREATGETHPGEVSDPQTGTSDRLQAIAANLETLTGIPVHFSDITDQIRKPEGTE